MSTGPGNIVALDVGDKTIGVAVSDDLGLTAQGVGVVRRQGDKHDFPALMAMVADRSVVRWVVGWPLNMDGSEGPRAQKTRRFAQRLLLHTPAPVLMWDERLSTWEAEQVLTASGLRRDKHKQVVDMLAAQVILQTYLGAGAPEHGETP